MKIPGRSMKWLLDGNAGISSGAKTLYVKPGEGASYRHYTAIEGCGGLTAFEASQKLLNEGYVYDYPQPTEGTG